MQLQGACPKRFLSTGICHLNLHRLVSAGKVPFQWDLPEPPIRGSGTDDISPAVGHQRQFSRLILIASDNEGLHFLRLTPEVNLLDLIRAPSFVHGMRLQSMVKP